MKTIITILAVLMFATIGLSQSSTKKMSYQAVIRNSSNVLVQNSSVSIKISILITDVMGPSVYVETHTKLTNQNGLLDLQIGGGTVISGSFNDINWGVQHFLKTEIDPTGGTNYTIITSGELLSVPFSNYSHSSNISNYAYSSGTTNSLNGVAWQFVGAYLGVFEGYSYINYLGATKISLTFRDSAGDNNGNGTIDIQERTYNISLYGTVVGNVVTFPPQPWGDYIGLNIDNSPEITGTLLGSELTLTGNDDGSPFLLTLMKQ